MLGCRKETAFEGLCYGDICPSAGGGGGWRVGDDTVRSLLNCRAASKCWELCQARAAEASVIYFFQPRDVNTNNRPTLQMRRLRLSKRTCSRLPSWEDTERGLASALEVRAGAASPWLTGVGGFGFRQASGDWSRSLSTAQSWPRGRAKAEHPSRASWRRGAFWAPDGPGTRPIRTGNLALLLVSKLFRLVGPQISHPSNGIMPSGRW